MKHIRKKLKVVAQMKSGYNIDTIYQDQNFRTAAKRNAQET